MCGQRLKKWAYTLMGKQAVSHALTGLQAAISRSEAGFPVAGNALPPPNLDSKQKPLLHSCESEKHGKLAYKCDIPTVRTTTSGATIAPPFLIPRTP